ncbi:hypothetical protein PL10110_160050 [Planktothrix agardhii]|nr:hypothetical protein PL10110_160050 [Planktothrix agardhii]
MGFYLSQFNWKFNWLKYLRNVGLCPDHLYITYALRSLITFGDSTTKPTIFACLISVGNR